MSLPDPASVGLKRFHKTRSRLIGRKSFPLVCHLRCRSRGHGGRHQDLWLELSQGSRVPAQARPTLLMATSSRRESRNIAGNRGLRPRHVYSDEGTPHCCPTNRRATRAGRSRPPSSPASILPRSRPCPIGRPCWRRTIRPGTCCGPPSPPGGILAETRPPPVPIPPRLAAGTSSLSCRSATTHRPAHRSSSCTTPDGDSSAGSRGYAQYCCFNVLARRLAVSSPTCGGTPRHDGEADSRSWVHDIIVS